MKRDGRLRLLYLLSINVWHQGRIDTPLVARNFSVSEHGSHDLEPVASHNGSNKSSTPQTYREQLLPSCNTFLKLIFMLSLTANFFTVWVDQWWLLKATSLSPSAIDNLTTYFLHY